MAYYVKEHNSQPAFLFDSMNKIKEGELALNGMKKAIKIGSNTLAMRGCELLRQNGITCDIRKISDAEGRYGCIYTINVSENSLWQAEKILRSSGIMVLP